MTPWSGLFLLWIFQTCLRESSLIFPPLIHAISVCQISIFHQIIEARNSSCLLFFLSLVSNHYQDLMFVLNCTFFSAYLNQCLILGLYCHWVWWLQELLSSSCIQSCRTFPTGTSNVGLALTLFPSGRSMWLTILGWNLLWWSCSFLLQHNFLQPPTLHLVRY